MTTNIDKLESIDKKIRYSLHSEVFAYLADDPYGEHYEAEIRHDIHLSAGGVHKSLKDLVEAGLILKHNRGKLKFYQFNAANPISRQYKILLNVRRIWPFLFDNIVDISDKIVLFGSTSRGENLPDSDIDLFVLSKNASLIEKAVAESNWAEKIQLIAVDQGQELAMDEELKREIEKGFLIWERTDDSSKERIYTKKEIEGFIKDDKISKSDADYFGKHL